MKILTIFDVKSNTIEYDFETELVSKTNRWLSNGRSSCNYCVATPHLLFEHVTVWKRKALVISTLCCEPEWAAVHYQYSTSENVIVALTSDVILKSEMILAHERVREWGRVGLILKTAWKTWFYLFFRYYRPEERLLAFGYTNTHPYRAQVLHP